MRHLLTLIITILSLVTIGCDDGQQSATSRGPSSASPKPQQSPKPQTPTIPDDVSYSIIDSTTMPGIKRSLDVRLNKKVSERTLRALALKLKSQDSRNYERTFIGYYLPDMKLGAGAWATTHFDPNLEVRILGLTAKQEEALRQQPDDPSREIIGSWIDDRMHLGNRTTIFRQDGKLFMENTYADGSSGKKEIVAKPSSSSERFEDKRSRSTKKGPETAVQRFLKVKLRELDSFKSKPEFHRFGFGQGGPYNSWLTDVESKRDSPGFSLVGRVAVGDLQMLGLEYMATHGKENEYTKFARRSIRDVIRDENSALDLREFYLIDSQGNLQLWDKDGLISTAKRIGG